jgi:hypothetical protein
MIVDFFINLIASLVNLLPSLPDNLTFSFVAIYDVFNTVNYYLPVSEFFTCLLIYAGFLSWRLLFYFIKFLIERIVI